LFSVFSHLLFSFPQKVISTRIQKPFFLSFSAPSLMVKFGRTSLSIYSLQRKKKLFVGCFLTCPEILDLNLGITSVDSDFWPFHLAIQKIMDSYFLPLNLAL